MTFRYYIILILPFLNNHKNLDPSYKTDLDLWDCFGRQKNSVLQPKKYGNSFRDVIKEGMNKIKLVCTWKTILKLVGLYGCTDWCGEGSFMKTRYNQLSISRTLRYLKVPSYIKEYTVDSRYLEIEGTLLIRATKFHK